MVSEKDDILKTGTTTIGIVCKDGIVLAADKRTTAGNLIVSGKTNKIVQINEYSALTTAGTVSDSQLIIKILKAELKLKELRTGRKPSLKEIANLCGGLIYNNIRKMSMIPGISHFVLGGNDNTGFYLYDLFADGSITEIDEFVASGSGSVFALGVLETLYNKDIAVDDAVALAVKAVNAALQRDTASGNGIDVVTITKDGVQRIMEQKLDTKLKV